MCNPRKLEDLHKDKVNIFQEWETNVISLKKAQVQIFSPVLGKNTLQLFTKRRNGDEYHLSTHNYCGFWQFEFEGDTISIEIRPKVVDKDAVSWSNLLPLLYASQIFPNIQGSSLLKVPEEDRNQFLIYIIKSFERNMQELFKKGLRSQHDRHHETLVSRRKGQLHISKYIQNAAKGNVLHFPCTYSTLLIDTALNQMVKSGLRKALQLAQSILNDKKNEKSISQVSEIITNLKKYHYNLQMIQNITLHRIDIGRLKRRLSKTVLPRPYHNILELVEFMKRNENMQEQSGKIHTFGLSFDMPIVFERALGNLLKKEFKRYFPKDDITTNAIWKYKKDQKTLSRSMKPDILCLSQSWVMDAKWKTLENFYDNDPDESDENNTKLTVNRNDLFQIISYCRILELKNKAHDLQNSFPSQGFLIFPSVLSEKECIPEKLSITVDDEDLPLEIWIVPWKISDSDKLSYTAEEGIQHLRRSLFPTVQETLDKNKTTDQTQKNVGNL